MRCVKTRLDQRPKASWTKAEKLPEHIGAPELRVRFSSHSNEGLTRDAYGMAVTVP